MCRETFCIHDLVIHILDFAHIYPLSQGMSDTLSHSFVLPVFLNEK